MDEFLERIDVLLHAEMRRHDIGRLGHHIWVLERHRLDLGERLAGQEGNRLVVMDVYYSVYVRPETEDLPVQLVDDAGGDAALSQIPSQNIRDPDVIGRHLLKRPA